jgi:adenine phosphoribosyltransferase
MMIKMLKAKIRDIPDFPQPGIIFKDITPLLGDGKAFSTAIDLLRQRYSNQRVDYVVGVEARGLVIGAALANALSTGFIMVRKPGKLPAETLQATYELEYGTDSLEIHLDAMTPGSQVVIVDDVLATGGTMAAVTELVAMLKVNIIEVAFLIELSFLNGRSRLQNHPLYSLIQY